jgi:hypothetical protein
VSAYQQVWLFVSLASQAFGLAAIYAALRQGSDYTLSTPLSHQ